MVRHSYLWWPWVQRHLDDRGWTNADLDRATDAIGQRVDQSVIGRWKNHGTEPLISSVRAVAKVFDEDVREAIVRAGLLTPAELDAAWPDPDDRDLSGVPDDAILDEVRRRMRPRTRKSPTAGQPRRRRQSTSNGSTSNGSTPTSSTTLDASAGADSTTVALPAHNGTPAPPPPPVEDEDGAGANVAQRDG